jgi:alkylation response protein AidB-like acyl-CoA dehydrogenase
VRAVTAAAEPGTVLARLRALAAEFARERRERQLRRELARADFDRIREAGFLLTAVPREHGGLWEDTRRSLRPVADAVRTLAHGDPSVALVCAMHPGVLAIWLIAPEAPPPVRDAWAAQRRQVFETARDGAWWGTIVSEPGTGGDITRTKAVARPAPSGEGYLITGQKGFGSGSGIMAFMVTTAVPAGEADADCFVLDMRQAPWDGSAGLTLSAAWDGHGMIATQSHAMAFRDVAATRLAWPGTFLELAGPVGGVAGCLFAAVAVGIVESALESARRDLRARGAALRPYEQVEWARAELEGWLIRQAHEGMLRAVERDGGAPLDVVQGKTAIAELAESALARICRVMGGGTFSRHSPYGFWLQDVRSLGFLRPTWGVAYDRLVEGAGAGVE